MGTALLNLYGMYDAAGREFVRRGRGGVRPLFGNDGTSVAMAGCSASPTKGMKR